jgi:hypothetical protein
VIARHQQMDQEHCKEGSIINVVCDQLVALNFTVQRFIYSFTLKRQARFIDVAAPNANAIASSRVSLSWPLVAFPVFSPNLKACTA